MPAPCLDLRHLKTSKQYNAGRLINRYWFEWSNRRDLKNLVIRLDLLTADGTVLTTSSVRLPKTKVTSYIAATDTTTEKPVYDLTVWIQIDDVVRESLPVSFRYYTVTGFSKKSESVTGAMDGIYDDISSLG